MTAYAILRVAKLKTFSNIAGSLAHNYRTRETCNADPAKTHLNIHTVPDGPDLVMSKIKERLPKNRRKNAVLCVEYMVSSSPGALTNAGHKGFLEDALKWLKQRHGAENVVAATVHRDETTPHLCAYVVPLDEFGKLNAKKFLGGRSVLSAMQTDFARQVGSKYQLSRGIEGSPARHTSVKAWYARLDESDTVAQIPPHAVCPRIKEKKRFKQDVLETSEEVADRLNEGLGIALRPILVKAKMCDFERKRASEIRNLVTKTQRQIEDANERLRLMKEQAVELMAVYQNLTPGQWAQFVQQAKMNQNIRRRCKMIRGFDICDSVSPHLARFVALAKGALHDPEDRWWKVDWVSIERQYREGELLLGTSETDVIQVILEHGPRWANTSTERVREVLERFGKSQSLPSQSDSADVFDTVLEGDSDSHHVRQAEKF